MSQLEVVLFGLALAGYSVGTISYLVYLGAKNQLAAKIGIWSLVAGWLVHLASIALRWSQVGHVPLTNQFEFLSFLARTTVAIYLFTEIQTRQKIIGAFAVPLVWIIMGVAWLNQEKATSGATVPAILQSPWFVVHVTVAVVSFAAFALAFSLALIYLMQERHLKTKSTNRILKRLPALQDIDNISYRAVVLGFSLLTITLISGMIWAQQVFGSFWKWDPKITAALATWIIFGAYLHARLTAGWQGRRSALIATVGFAAVLITFGVSYFAGPHIESFIRSGG